MDTRVFFFVLLNAVPTISLRRVKDETPEAMTDLPVETTLARSENVNRVAFITAVFGNYEKTLKDAENQYFANASDKKMWRGQSDSNMLLNNQRMQDVATDFIAFTDRQDLKSNKWIIDTEPYHITHKPIWDDGSFRNSVSNNQHPFNFAKFYKEHFHVIPRLQHYDVIVWLDADIKIHSPLLSTFILNHIQNSTIISWNHHERKNLAEEVRASHFKRYYNPRWLGYPQPIQDVDEQYRDYLSDGYRPDAWHKMYAPDIENFGGVWVTSFVAFDMTNPATKEFLKLWYLENLKHTTQDQVSFPYVAQRLDFRPLTLPVGDVSGTFKSNTFFKNVGHGS